MFTRKYYTKEVHKSSSKSLEFLKKLTLVLLTIFLGNFLFNIYFYKTNLQTAVLLNPIATEIIHTATTLINSGQNSLPLENIVTKLLGNDKENFAVVIFNLQTGERYYLNEEKVFDTASLYKLWVMAVSYKQIEEGKFFQTDVLSDSIESINKRFDLIPDPTENESQIITWPVQNALANMITVSDNNSAYLLTEKVGINNISDFLSIHGFSESRVGSVGSNPQTSASDIAIFFQKLYSGEFASKEDTKKMIALLKDQQIDTKLTKYLPKNVVVAHKTGELGSFSHDVGIVFLPKGTYIIAILSKTDDQLLANEKIANTSKQIYDYFLK